MSSEITLLIVAVVALLAFVRFWRYILSAGILVAVIYICALMFANPSQPVINQSQSQTCYTPGGIEIPCN